MVTAFFILVHSSLIAVLAGNVQLLQFGEEYKNLTTVGNLMPTLFTVPIKKTFSPPAVRVVIMARTVDSFNPLTITAMRRSSILSAVLPRIQTHDGKVFKYWFTADTLCDELENTSTEDNDAVQVAVSSMSPAIFNLIVREIGNFNIMNNAVSVKSTPSEPVAIHLRYTFPAGVDTVAVQIESMSDICAQMMVRENHCPVFDTSGEIEKAGTFFFQTFSRHAHIAVKKSDIGEIFHIIVTVKQDDSDCGFSKNMSDNMFRIKQVEIRVIPVSDEKISLILPIIVYFTLIVVAVFVSFYFTYLIEPENNETDSSSSDHNIANTSPTISHQQYQNHRDTDYSSYNRLFALLMVGSIAPSLTTLFRIVSDKYSSSNLDACNINFSCAIEFLGFPAFNNMISASGMIVVGIGNLIFIFKHHIFHNEVPNENFTDTGVNRQNAAKVVTMLSIIGLGCYWTVMHSCPSKFTFHLYNYSVIWMSLSAFIWIYSKRHNMRKWHQSYIIIVATVLSTFTFWEKNFVSGHGNKLLGNFLLFMSANLFNGFFCYQYLYEKPSDISEYNWIHKPFSNKIDYIMPQENVSYKPLESKKVFALVLTMFTIAWTLVPFFSAYFNHTKCILRLVQVDLVIYLLFYIIQKIRLERLTFTKRYVIFVSTLFIILVASIMFWALIVLKFNTTFIPWSAAQSRTLNTPCVLPGIDWHDILHYVSAVICFVFILLIDHIDSNLNHVRKTAIYVF